MYFLRAISIVFFLSLFACTEAQLPLVVETEGGWVSGVLSSDGEVIAFKGVPYAAPPTGQLRWKEPQSVLPWDDTLSCDVFPPSPIQTNPVPFRMWTQEFITPAEPLSEDCLYLNIWTTAKGKKKPVFVWIHGGGFVSGSGACPIYDGEAYAREGIVYVSINYRLGVFGFMAHPELTDESPNSASGNYGLLDQLAALRWVRDNIEAFGGDPQQVTVAGQSAGSMSVQSLVASPLGRGLFQRAIAQSGGSLMRPSTPLIEAEKIGQALSEKVGGGLQALRDLPADSLLVQSNQFPYGSFSPIIDGHVIPDDMRKIFAQRKHNDVPVLMGWVLGDGSLRGTPMSREQFNEMVAAEYRNLSEEFFDVFPIDTDEALAHSNRTWSLMGFPAYSNYRWAMMNSSPTYLYEFSYVPTDKPGFPNYGAFHSSEVPYVLRNLKYWDRPWRKVDYTVERYVSSYWINFVKGGNPNGKELPEWSAYDREQGSIMTFDSVPKLSPALYKREFEFLNTVMESTN